MIGNRTRALHSLGQAEDEFANADRENLHPWTAFFDEAELRAIIGFTLTRLPDATASDLNTGTTHIAESFDGRAPDDVLSRVLALPMLAAAHLRTGDADEALRVADEAVAGVSSMTSVRLLRRFTNLLPGLTAVGSSDALDLAHRIEELAATGPS
jgi:hypothetical protein